MSRIAYVNGRYLPLRQATVHIEDRGYQFSDGVYEVCEVRDGYVIDQRRHLARLQRSLDELGIAMPMSETALAIIAGTGCTMASFICRSPEGWPEGIMAFRLRALIPASW